VGAARGGLVADRSTHRTHIYPIGDAERQRVANHPNLAQSPLE
jgi:hypothetical protein